MQWIIPLHGQCAFLRIIAIILQVQLCCTFYKFTIRSISTNNGIVKSSAYNNKKDYIRFLLYILYILSGKFDSLMDLIEFNYSKENSLCIKYERGRYTRMKVHAIPSFVSFSRFLLLFFLIFIWHAVFFIPTHHLIRLLNIAWSNN